MSLKNRSARERSPPRRASVHRSRLRVLPLFVISKTFARSNRSLRTMSFRSIFREVRARHCRLRRIGRDDQAAASAAADLPALAAGVAGFVGGPLVGRPLFVRRAAALAGDLALLFGRHRCESATFF